MTPIWNLTKSDFTKAGVMFVLSSVLTTLVTMIQDGTVDWKIVGTTAITATLTYIIKQIGTDEDGKFAGKF